MIDSGIDRAVEGLDGYVSVSTGFRINEKGYITEYPGMEAMYPHGTIVSLIIRHICSSVEFISMNILNENAATDGRVLMYAMSRAFDYKPDIIHMSLGTTKWRYKRYVKKIVKEAYRQNVVLVAAANNEGHVSYPACVKGVFGVKGRDLKDSAHYRYKDGFFYAPFSGAGVKGYGGTDLKNACGTSMSAAYMTGHIANLMMENGHLGNEEIKRMLLLKIICEEW